ncbi:hypothetical protein GCM10020254_35330 [Streptomyces goshikiensis]
MRTEGDALHGAGPPGDPDMVVADEIAVQGLNGGHHTGQMARRQPVVAVHEGEVLAPGRVQTGVPRGRQAAVALVAQVHRAGQLPRGPFQKVGSPVRRVVVDEQELEVVPGIERETFQGIRCICLHVVERHDNRELEHLRDVRPLSGIHHGPHTYSM